MDREECLSHDVKYEGDTVHFSFVVINSEGSRHYSPAGVDLVVKGPGGEQIHDFRDKTSDIGQFVSSSKGVHRFCFYNKSPYHEMIDFDVREAHFSHHEEHAKDDHFNPLIEQISKLQESIYGIWSEQHYLDAQSQQQALVNLKMSKGTIYKACFESVALVGASALQAYLLKRLFDRKMVLSRV
ncbi:transmembrane emp24 domain-containing protein p24beta2-like [Impatiens glandulifera]|uniref:transmembrane emp24 domain-containing protein p24beta2-like n=1 Tax=Impatiens glandulifera TaxID=253017 RepID=UPI001FB17CD3|nr:transmembrane emp24 domain-containing protein p24beta2-like [Impatiens glandulifera]